MLNVVRSQSMHTPWDLMVQRTSQLVKEGSLSDTFHKIMKEMNSSNVNHLLTLYALNDLERIEQVALLYSHYPRSICDEIGHVYFNLIFCVV